MVKNIHVAFPVSIRALGVCFTTFQIHLLHFLIYRDPLTDALTSRPETLAIFPAPSRSVPDGQEDAVFWNTPNEVLGNIQSQHNHEPTAELQRLFYLFHCLCVLNLPPQPSTTSPSRKILHDLAMAVLGSKAESKLAIWCYFGIIAAIAFNKKLHKGKIALESSQMIEVHHQSGLSWLCTCTFIAPLARKRRFSSSSVEHNFYFLRKS